MTQGELDALMESLRQELLRMNIPVSERIKPEVAVNTRVKRRLGCCFYKDGGYAIEVSASLLDDRSRLRETLVHELLHTCPNCRNHGERWKAYAEIVNRELGYSVQRLAPPTEDSGVRLRCDSVKYVLECQSCGAKILRARMSKAVKYPWRYRCKCGGKLAVFRIETAEDDGKSND